MAHHKTIRELSPFCHHRPKRYPLDMVIVHHIGSKGEKLYTASGAIKWFTDEELHRNKTTGKIENKVSAHYVIPREPWDDVNIIQCVEDKNVAYHAGVSQWTVNGKLRKNINNYSLGIELEGDGNLVEYTDYQYEELIWLIRSIRTEYNVPEQNILGHEDVAPGRKVDPGTLFDWKRVREGIRLHTTITMPATTINGTPPQVSDENFSMEGGEAKSPCKSFFLSTIFRFFSK